MMGPENRELPDYVIKEGVIAVILRPSGDGTYSYYLLDHNHYSQDEEGVPKTVHAGVGLLSETMQTGEDPQDYLGIMARGYVEEIMGMTAEEVGEEQFQNFVQEARESMETNLREIGYFTHDFNYNDPSKYTSDPNTRGHVHVFIDDNCRMDTGDINQHEVAYAGYLGNSDLDHRYIHYRSGYNTRLLLGSAELQDILTENDITIAE